MLQKWLAADRIALPLLAGVMIAGLAGCGSGPRAMPGPTPTPTPTPAPTPTPNPAPNLGSISPSNAPAGALAFTLTVNGSNFVASSTVQWDGSSRTTTFISSSQLQAQITATDLATPGKITVTVVNPAPGGGASSAATFTVAVDTIVFMSTRALDGSNAADPGPTENIWVMNPDGSGVTALTNITVNLAGNFNPVWSPDGSRIAFSSSRALDGSNADNTNNNSNVWEMNADGSNLAPLTKLTKAESGGPAFSPDGGKIVFSSTGALDGSDNPNNAGNIWVMNLDGSGAAPLTRATAQGVDSFSPLWSPDGSKIVFFSSRALDSSDAPNANGTVNIWVMKADGSGEIPLTKLTAPGVFPPGLATCAWSPDGSKIAFGSSRYLDGSDAVNTNSTSNIWVMKADGSGGTPLTQLTANGADSLKPQWSPDGSKIAFISSRAFNGFDYAGTTLNIWVMNADGSSAAPLTKLTQADNTDAVWSAGGAQLFFDSPRALDGSDAVNTNGTRNIWVVNADGSGAAALTKLTASSADSFTPKQP